MKKIFWGVVIILLVLVIAAVITAGFFLNPIVKKSVEAVGSKITRTSVTLDTVDLSLLTGSATINNFALGNPDGYKTTNAISAGNISVGMNPFSVLSDKIIMRSVAVRSPEITFEGGLGGNNLSKILDNVNSASQKGGTVATNATGQAKPAKKFEVDDFLISGAKVHVLLTDLGGKETTVDLPKIHLTNLGTGGDGLTAADLTRRVLQEIVSTTIKTVTSESANLGQSAQQLIQSTGKPAGSNLNQVGNLLKH